MPRLTLAVAATVVLFGPPAVAHHAIASIYDSGNPVTLEGVVVDFQFISPHPFVVVEAEDGKGARQKWRLDLDNRGELSSIGMTNMTFKAGDRVVVKGSPARDRSRSVYVRRLDRAADGFWYEQVGSSPRSSLRR